MIGIKTTRLAATPIAVAAAWAAFCAFVLYVQCTKGAIGQVQGWGLVYWWLDYSDGMVRRGLVGQLFQSLFGVLSPEALQAPVIAIHRASLLLIGGPTVVLSAMVIWRLSWRDRLIFAALAGWIFVSQLWATLAYNVGYLDSYVLVLAMAAALCLSRGWVAPTGVIMALGPFVHEYFLFLVPFVLAAGWRPYEAQTIDPTRPLDVPAGPPRRGTLIKLGLIALAATAIVLLTAHAPAAQAQLAAMPVSTAQKQALLGTTLGQGLGGATQRMIGLLTQDIGFTLGNFAFFLLPTAIAIAGVLWWKAPRGRIAPWIQAAAALFPASALLVAWDLSRLLVMTSFTAGTLFLMLALRRTAPGEGAMPADAGPSSWRVAALSVLSLAAAAAYGITPLTYTYFEGDPYFGYFHNRIGFLVRQSPVSMLYEQAWGVKPKPRFQGGDITCRLQPAAIGPDCSRLLRAGQMIYGPYVLLPEGDYRAGFEVAAPPSCRYPLRIDVFASDFDWRPLVWADFTPDQGKAHLDFKVGAALAGRGKIEFRVVQANGPACAVLKRVNLVRLQGARP